MPKVLLTQNQKEEERYRRLRKSLGERLATAKHRQQISTEQLAKQLDVGRESVAKLLHGEDVKLTSTTWFRLMDLAGISLKAKPDEFEKG